MAKFDTAELLEIIQRRGFIPAAQSTFSLDNMLKAADEELNSEISPLLLSIRGDFFTTFQDTPVTALQDAYRIPGRALGAACRDVQYIDSSGAVVTLTEIKESELPTLGANTNLTSSPTAFYIKDKQVVLYPKPSQSTGTLRLWIQMRPNRPVQVINVGVITAVNVGTQQLTISATPGSFTTGQQYDLIRATPQFEWEGTDLAITTLAANVLTFTNPLPSGIFLPAVGDYVCLAGETAVIQIPPELHVCVALRAAASMLKGMSKTAAAADLINEAKGKETKALILLTPRVKGRPQKLNNRQWL